jgi:hypothetical protein
MMRRKRVGWLLVLALTLGGCQPDQTPRQAGQGLPEREPVQPDRERVLRWLQCEECTEGELDSVRSLGSKPETVDTLSEDLLAGPADYRRANVKEQFESLYTDDSLDAVSEGSQPSLTRAEYVNEYLDNFINLYRVRAARALAEIGGPKAKAVLDSAVSGYARTPGDTLRADAQRRVLYVRDSIYPRERGTVDGPSIRAP